MSGISPSLSESNDESEWLINPQKLSLFRTGAGASEGGRELAQLICFARSRRCRASSVRPTPPALENEFCRLSELRSIPHEFSDDSRDSSARPEHAAYRRPRERLGGEPLSPGRSHPEEFQ